MNIKITFGGSGGELIIQGGFWGEGGFGNVF